MEQKNKVSCITFWMRERPAAPWGLKTWCLTTEDDVLPVNRTMKKYKICVTIILNFLLVNF